MSSKKLNVVVYTLLYGDLHEAPLSVLGEHCPSDEVYRSLDEEQKLRLHAAATLQKRFDEVITKNY
jgi:hypothetical protein